MAKGVELPINVLVIVAIAVVVLIGMVALYLVGFGPFSSAAGQQGIKNAACQELSNTRCSDSTTNILTPTFDSNKDGTSGGTGDNLRELANNYYGCSIPSVAPKIDDDDTTVSDAEAEICAKRLCGCPGA